MIRRIPEKVRLLKDGWLNSVLSRDIYYVVENAPWSVRHDGESITGALKGLSARVTTTARGVRRAIVHYGSGNLFFSDERGPEVSHSNKTVVTWFHIAPSDHCTDQISQRDPYVDVWHTSCQITAGQLGAYGASPEKIRVIPLGVNLKAFYSPIPGETARIRRSLGIPQGVRVIGSFQKDGNGWGEGNEPKMIKGPDVFCDVVEKIASQEKVMVLLCGPSRGYVRGRLERAGIPFLYVRRSSADEVAELYRALDLYIIGSRVEGGPKALWESMASGVPLVTTSVGMVPDWVEDGVNAMVAAVDDREALAAKALTLLRDRHLREKVVAEASNLVKKFDWSAIAEMYRARIYQPLLERSTKGA